MSRDYTPHEWHDHYNARASEAQRDADRTRAAADQRRTGAGYTKQHTGDVKP